MTVRKASERSEHRYSTCVAIGKKTGKLKEALRPGRRSAGYSGKTTPSWFVASSHNNQNRSLKLFVEIVIDVDYRDCFQNIIRITVSLLEAAQSRDDYKS